MKKKIVIAYSISHFIVDLACAILVANLIYKNLDTNMSIIMVMIFYNFFAFAFQLPIGIIADKVNKNAFLSGIGCLVVALGYAFYQIPILACIVAGIGNSLFHIGGGIDVLNISDKKASLSGIFVSTGALGIFLGSRSLKDGFTAYYIPIILLIISAAVLFMLYKSIKGKIDNEDIVVPKLNPKMVISIICLMMTVVVRSYVGFILNFSWKSELILAIFAIAAVILGKMLGGIIGDRIGFIKSAVISLVIAAIGFIFAFNNSIIGIISILLFNMTMPITLIALANMLNNNKGLAFGLLTFALFIGGIPIFLGQQSTIFNEAGLFGITMISAIVLCIGLKLYYDVMEKLNDND